MPQTKLTVNGTTADVDGPPDRTLLEALREDLQLTGTKYGCGEGECGACTVHLNGEAVHACQTSVAEASGREVTTVEGLSTGDALHPVQQAFLDANAFQCGYCTSGMMMCAAALLASNPDPSDAEIVDGMNGNLCRCCGYVGIADAVRRAANARKEAAK